MAGHSQRRSGRILLQRRKKNRRARPVLSLRNRIHRCRNLLRDKPPTPDHHRKTGSLRHTLRRHRSSGHEPHRRPALSSPQTRVLRKSLRDSTGHPHLLRRTSNRPDSRSLNPLETRATQRTQHFFPPLCVSSARSSATFGSYCSNSASSPASLKSSSFEFSQS